MKFIADLHIHSHFSLATSKLLVPEYLELWARIKGINLVATGDFTHPKWANELEEKLEPAEQGLFKLKSEFRIPLPISNPELEKSEVRFILSAEISNIYKKGGKVRKVHNLIYAPDFKTIRKIQNSLEKIGNIRSDGRPILGLDSHDLLEICLNASPDIFLVPAHIWTPWFSVLGEKSGFDSVEECFGNLSSHIFAVETGLSTDAPLNWMCSFLDRFALLSNSDAHSPEKLGRNANRFDCEMNYTSLFNALKNTEGNEFAGTIDFYPQEGKYHYDGHRNCGICWNPLETLQHKGICPVCKKKVVLGVVTRIAQLSDRNDINERPNKKACLYTIPLTEILSEIYGAGASSKKVMHQYYQLIKRFGSELNILLNKDFETLEQENEYILSEAIRRMRNGEVYIQEGFDGEYGQIKVFTNEEVKGLKTGKNFEKNNKTEPTNHRKLLNFDLTEYQRLASIIKLEKPTLINEQLKLF